MDGIGRKKSIQVRSPLGISGNIKMNELTKSQIDQMEQMISQDHVVHWELKRGERADIERLICLSRYRRIRHQDGSPLRGQQTHTNARTCRKEIKVKEGERYRQRAVKKERQPEAKRRRPEHITEGRHELLTRKTRNNKRTMDDFATMNQRRTTSLRLVRDLR